MQARVILRVVSVGIALPLYCVSRWSGANVWMLIAVYLVGWTIGRVEEFYSLLAETRR